MSSSIIPKSSILCALLLAHILAQAQHITGTLPVGCAHDDLIRLLVSRGSTVRLIDSTRISAEGRFAFDERAFPLGFYHLAINDTDQVDIILDPREKHVELEFKGVPLQRSIRVKRSEENQRLWEYKLVSKESQAVQASVLAEKKNLKVGDTKRMMELDSIAARAVSLQQAHLKGVIEGHPESYFAKVVRADIGIDDARDQNPMAVLKVFDLSDPSLMRSSVYDKAVLTFLRNIHVVSEEQFISASDSLLAYASGDPECRAYMLDHLIDLYSTYGPEIPLQYLIDKYVVSAEGMAAIDPSLHAKVNELLKVAVGAPAPDVEIPDPVAPFPLRGVVEKNRFTLLFFYSSTCEHCHAQMEGIKEIYSKYRPQGLDVLGIALDPDSTEFQRTIAEKHLPWKCYSEFTGWGSIVAKAYRVKATPFFFLLDQRMTIVAKPVDALDLQRWLDGHVK